jgi:predicted TIM-barrel fold metal-dependent hydrolase
MDEMLSLLDATPCAAFHLVCLPERSGVARNGPALGFKARHPGRTYVSAALDYASDVPLAAQARSLRVRGFDGLKMIEGKPEVRKLLPLALDGPAYADMWAELERQGLPVVLHLGDPPCFWDHSACPQWARDAGWFYGDGSYPTLNQLRAELGNVLARHPGLKLVLAHFAFLSHDLPQAAALLDAHPNLSFDLAPHLDMYDDFSRSPDAARAFFAAYRDRILYGTDLDTRALARGPEGAALLRFIPRLIRSMLETHGEFRADGGKQYCGLNLPSGVLAAIYSGNFTALYGSRPVPLGVADA